MLEPGERFVLDASRTELGDINGVGLITELPRDVRPAMCCCSTTARIADRGRGAR